MRDRGMRPRASRWRSRLAKILGGKATKHTSERNSAEIVLSLDQAREFIQKWRASLDAA